MKKSNKEFVAEFMNQLDSGKLIQVIQGLLNQEEITVQDEQIVVSKPEIIQETAIIQENNDTNITIEKLSVSEKPTFASSYRKNDDDDESLVNWFANASQRYLEPKKPVEVPIEQDLYGLMFTPEGKVEAERLKTLEEAEFFAKMSPEEQREALTIKKVLEEQEILKKLQIKQKKDSYEATERTKLLPKDYVSSYDSLPKMPKSRPAGQVFKENRVGTEVYPLEKTRAELELAEYEAAKYRVDNNLPGRNFAESLMNTKVKNDRLAKEINNKMLKKDYQDAIFPELVAHIAEVTLKNRELEEKEKLKPQIDAIEKELDDLLMKDLSEN